MLMSHVCSPTPVLDVIVPTLVSRKVDFAFKAWLEDWKIDSCVCVRVILVLDAQGSTEYEVAAMEKEVSTYLPNDKVLLVTIGYFGSPGAARNAGLGKSVAEWLVFWDSDDSPVYESLETVLGNLKDSQNYIHFYQYETWSIERSEIEVVSRDARMWSIARNPGLWRMIIPGLGARKYRFSHYVMGEDVAYVVQLLTSNYIDGIKYFPEKLYRYNKYTKGQLTSSKSALKDLPNSLDLMSQFFRSRSNTKKSNVNLAMCIFTFQYLSLVKRQPVTAFKNLKMFLSTILSFFKFGTRKVFSDYSKRVDNQQVFLYALGGLGNQLFQYAAARYYATAISRIKIISDAGTPRQDSRGLPALSVLFDTGSENLEFISVGRKKLVFSRLANVLLRINIHESALLNNPMTRFLFIKSFQPIFSLMLRSWVKVIVCHKHGFTPNISVNRRNLLVIGYFQSYEYASIIREEVKKKLNKVGKSTLSEKSKVRIDRIPNALVIHVRRGDYLAERQIGCLSEEYFIQAMEKVSQEDYEEAWVFVEDEESASFLEKHLPKRSRIFSSNDYSTLETLALMSFGSGYIISNSTFSWWGAYLSQHLQERVRVLAPTPWYREIREPNRLVPEDWEKSNSDWIKG